MQNKYYCLIKSLYELNQKQNENTSDEFLIFDKQMKEQLNNLNRQIIFFQRLFKTNKLMDQDKNESMSIEDFLISFETKQQIKILFAVETGSRGFGTAVDESDYDIKGFFVRQNIAQYFLIDRVEEEYCKQHNACRINGKEVTLDYQFQEVRKAFADITVGKIFTTSWMKSPCQYRNDISDQIGEILEMKFLPFNDHIGRFLSYKEAIKEPQVKAKTYINAIINFAILFEIKTFNTFTFYNAFQEIDYIIKLCQEQNLQREKIIFEQLKSSQAENMELKKQGRLINGEKISEQALQFMEEFVCKKDFKKQKILEEQKQKIVRINSCIYNQWVIFS